MPKLSEQIPKYRKHRASGQAVVTLNGKDHYLGPHGTKVSKAEYDRLVGEWLAAGRQSPLDEGGELTVVEVCNRYWKFARVHYRDNPKVMPGIKCALKYLRERYGRTAAVEFGPLALKAIRQWMVDEGLSRTYVNDHVGRIKRMFRWAVGEQLLPVENYQALAVVPGLRRGQTKARETDPVLPVDEVVVEATLPKLPAVVADMVRLQKLAGMRPAEVCIIRPRDIDRTGDVWVYRPAKHKTEHRGRERSICLGPQAQAILLRYLARDAEAYCFRPVDSEAKRRAEVHASRKTPLSCGNRPGSNLKRKPKHAPGDCYKVDAYRRAITRACEKAGVTHWSPNQLRHSAATEIRKRFGLEAAQVTLGHAAADVTQVYAERDLAKAADVMRQIG